MRSKPLATTQRTTDKDRQGGAPARWADDVKLNPTEPHIADVAVGSALVPDDVRAELDADERRVNAEPGLGAPAVEVPEDVRSDLDREARLGRQEVLQRLAEGEGLANEEFES